jgi:hypothetical protein
MTSLVGLKELVDFLQIPFFYGKAKFLFAAYEVALIIRSYFWWVAFSCDESSHRVD